MSKSLVCVKCIYKHVYEPTDENIDNIFGRNKKGEPFKTCIRCRKYVSDYYQQNKDAKISYVRQWELENKERIKERLNQRITCENCGACVTRGCLSKHKKTQKCLAVDSTT